MPCGSRVVFNCCSILMSMPVAQGQEGRPHRGMPERQTNREGARSCRHLPDSRQYASVKRRDHGPTAGAVGIGITETGRAGLGAVVTGLGLESPAPAAQETLRRAFRASPMLCIRGCEATPESFLRLARAFGTAQRELLGVLRDPAFPEISLVERRQGISTATGKPATFGGHWHTDDSYMAVPCAATPLPASLCPNPLPTSPCPSPDLFISLRRRALAPLAWLRAYARAAVAPSGLLRSPVPVTGDALPVGVRDSCISRARPCGRARPAPWCGGGRGRRGPASRHAK